MSVKEIKCTLILADGTILENCDCGLYDKGLWCFLYDISFDQAYQYFSRNNAFRKVTLELQYIDFIDKITYTGFEEIVSISRHRNAIIIHLEGYKIEEDKERIRYNQENCEEEENSDEN